ncbi:MAG: PAS domain S-box protein [Trueperaceae bacterium]|nr:PAS domain S-box protein [Trueperaceae bacterium]
MNTTEAQSFYDVLLKERELLNALLDSVDDGIVACDDEGKLTLFNKATRDFHGLPEKVMAVDDLAAFYDLYYPDGRTLLETKDIPLLKALRGEQVQNIEIIIAPKEGKRRTVLCNGRALRNDEGDIVGAVVAMHDVSGERLAQQDLRLGEERFRAIFNSTLQFIGFLTPDGVVLEANQTALDFGGLSREDVVGKPFWETKWWSLSSTTQEDLKAAIAEAAQGKAVRYSVDVLGAGEQVISIDFSLRPVLDEAARVVALVPEGRDVTEQIQAEKRLAESEARFHSAFDQSPIGMALVSPEGKWLEVNASVCQFFGYSREELLKTDFQALTHPDDLYLGVEALENLRLGQLPKVQFEKRYVHKNGEIIWALVSSAGVRDEQNQLLYLVSQIKDITERKLTEAKLRESERKLSRAQQVAHLGYWEWNTTTEEVKWSEELYDMYGFSKGEPISFARHQAIIHPEDREKTDRIVNEALKAKGKFQHSYRILLGEQIRHIQSQGEVDLAANGDIVMFGTSLDISNLKRQEQQLKESESKFRSIFETQPTAVVYTDPNGRIVEINPAVNELFAYQEVELLGRNIWVLFAAGTDYQTLLNRLEASQDKTLWNYELNAQRKDGQLFPSELTGSLRLDDEGTILGHVWIFQDVSLRKEAQEGLNRAHQRLARAREEERLHIARELHDQSVQDLIGISYRLATLQRGFEAEQAENIAQIRRDIVDVVKQLRVMISELRPAGLDEFGFESSLEGFIAKTARNRQASMPEVKLSIEKQVDQLPGPILVCLFRTAQESINNSLKHAKASELTVRLQFIEDSVVMVVEDDGQGFTVPENVLELTQKQHFGLAGILERVKLMGGTMNIHSQKGLGTEISVTLPADSEVGRG